MDAGREVAIAVAAQWHRCVHVHTVVDASGVVSLESVDVEPSSTAGPVPRSAGLAVGPDRRVYRAIPEDGRIVRSPWRPGTRQFASEDEDLLTPQRLRDAGAFTAIGTTAPPVAATALAVSPDGLLALVDATDGAVVVLDLVDGRPIRRERLSAVDLALAGDELLVCVDDPAQPLWRLPWRRSPRPVSGSVPARPARVAVAEDGTRWVLAGERVYEIGGKRILGPVAGATDVEVDGQGRVVVAGLPGSDFARYLVGDGVSSTAPLRAPRYDGRGLARTPDGRIAYWAGKRLGVGFPASVRYRTEGEVRTFALDSGGYGRRWGRIFVDACVPDGAALRVECLTSDDGEPPPATGKSFALHRRGQPELPWTRADDFVTYEAPVNAPPGRFLWLVLTLRGTPAVTPRVRAVRVEKAAPHLIDKLPAVYSAEPRAAAFLDRYLTMLAGPLFDVEAAAEERHVLLDPSATPAELLPWLASLVGLVLDDRWPEPARRELIARAVPLFRARGTAGALREMIKILLGVEPVLVERFRFRSVADPDRVDAGFAEHAHRFSVVVRGRLSSAQAAALRDLLDEHRPAHTVVEICTAGSARLGLGWHLALTSVVGPEAGFGQLAVGGVVGRNAVLGRPSGGLRVGAGRLGQDARVEP
ncbi:phage tail protein I [Lentzea sp. BCCO 10_0856]|uniref:Phage tail protein I n=1 Tax=Lentzea miocenica TaxID=3095431 RepID=A0ABU4SZR1_9PSEU|nr:phage tail protein I [Lentzea sp. BCCO 10_0856]MDX8031395.1 phage tail protein I [Lentzea sp. BCCO 10_0856]